MINSWYLILATLAAKQSASLVLDLGHGYQNQTTICWNPNESFKTFGEMRVTDPIHGWYSIESFSTSEHCGTHLDAPFHFNKEGWKLDEIPLERMVAEGVHLNVSNEVNGNGSFLLTVGHLRAWENANGPLPNRSVILVNFGWAHKFGDRELYYNGAQRQLYRFPGVSRDAAQWIVNTGKVYGLGVDTPSIDAGEFFANEAHKILSKANMYNLENVALNGTTLPAKGFKLVVQPIKIVGGTGGPCRILAFTNNAFE